MFLSHGKIPARQIAGFVNLPLRLPAMRDFM
jgi:hypothetical protein